MPPKTRVPASTGTKAGAGRTGAAVKPVARAPGRLQQQPAKKGVAGRGSVPGHRGKASAGVAVGKKVSPSPNKDNKVTEDKKSKQREWTKQDDMARKIQRVYRGYRARKLLLTLRKKKEEYENTMEKLQREAYVYMARLEKERAELAQKREEEARRRRREHLSRIKRMLESAFDGDTAEIRQLLKEVAGVYSESGEASVSRHQYKLVECTDPNNNTPLSEAAAGGDPPTIRFLVELGADPNTKGQFGRTPLYRASFAGHLRAVQVLLELGADPRLRADDGATPEQVAAQEEVEKCLQAWQVEKTDSLLKGLEETRGKRIEEERKLKQSMENELQSEIQEIEKEYESKQKQLKKAHEELNKRINEHDEYGASKGDITLPAVHDAEDLLERCKLQATEAREKLQQTRLKLRIKKKEFQGIIGEDEEEEDEKVNVVINIRELDDVLIKDVGNNISSSGKWPLILDSGQQATTFLRYRDTNYMNVCNPRHMQAESIRMALLGAIRYGKFVVLDLMDVEEGWEAARVKFDCVKKDLLQDLISMELMKDDKYLSLIKPSDGEEYSAKMFGSRVSRFKLVVVTQLFVPPKATEDLCYVIRIHTPLFNTSN